MKTTVLDHYISCYQKYLLPDAGAHINGSEFALWKSTIPLPIVNSVVVKGECQLDPDELIN